MSSAIETRGAPLLTGERRPVMIRRVGGVLVALCAVLGAVIAVTSTLRSAPTVPNRPAFEVGIAHPAPTSFGIVAVEYAQFLGGPTLNALTGSNHNVGALVPPDKMQVETTVTITNFSKHTVDYSPTQFSLLVGNNAKPVLAKHASTGEGTLQPDAGIDVRLTFVTSLSKKDITLRYVERDGSGPILMRLGHHSVAAQAAHGEKPGQVLGVGQTYHEQHQATDPTSPSSTDHVHTTQP